MCDDEMLREMERTPKLSRRDFTAITASAAAMAGTAAYGDAAVTESDVTVTTPDGAADAVLLHPQGKKSWPAVLIWTDIMGLRPVFREIGRRLASQGYVVLVPNPFYRTAKAADITAMGLSFAQPEGREKLIGMRRAMSDQGVDSDARAYLAFLDAQPQTDKSQPAGVQGYCMGGALSFRAGYPEAHYNLANALTDAGRPKDAAEHFRVALQGMPGSADVHNNLGIALADEGKRDDAIVEFRAAVAADPASAKSHRNLADALAGAGRSDEALVEFRRAAQLAPGDAAIRYDLGSFLMELDRTEEAIVEFRAALKLSPRSVEAHNNLGIALATQGRMDDAISHWRAALAIDPDFADAKKNLETALRARRRP